MPTERKRCLGRTPGNVLTSYACASYARPGSEYCYAHDPATEAQRMESVHRSMEDRRLERESRAGWRTCHYCSSRIAPDAVRYAVNGVGPEVECRACRERQDDEESEGQS
jgi:hypothetical protein